MPVSGVNSKLREMKKNPIASMKTNAGARAIRRKRCALLVTNIPNPYRIPQFNLLSEEFERNSIRFIVVYGARGYRERMWVYDDSELKHEAYFLDERIRKSAPRLYPGFTRALVRFSPDVIIGNGFSLATAKAAMYCHLTNRGMMIMAETIAGPNGVTGVPVGLIRGLMTRQARKMLLSGSKSREYVVSLPFGGRTPVETGVLNIDTRVFEALGERRQIHENRVVKRLLFTGYLNKRKNAQAVIHLAARLAKKRSDFLVTIVGDGEERPSLERLTVSLGVATFVSFVGYKQYKEILHYYAASDIFLFPTHYDIWGLVLNEAMASGLACIVSDKANAHVDLIQDGVNGYVRSFSDLDSVEALLLQLLDDPERVYKVGKTAVAFIRDHASINKSVQIISDSVLEELENLK